jgi:hypothetical protein
MTSPQITLQVSLNDAGNIMSALNSKANDLVGIINTIQAQVSAQVTPPSAPTPPGDGQTA